MSEPINETAVTDLANLSLDPPKKRKSVGFAPEPEEDLKEHHKYLEERKKEKLKTNPFWKIPAELSYLEPRQEGPKPLPALPQVTKPKKTKKFEDLKDLPTRAVKEISVVNKNTPLNFYYHEIGIPVGNDRILVDVKYAALSSFDISKLSKYLINLTNTRVGLGFDFVGEIVATGSNFDGHPDFKIGTTVFGVTNPYERKGALQTLVIINPNDIIVPVSSEMLQKMENIDVNLVFSTSSPFSIDEDNTQSTSSSDLFLSDGEDEGPKPVSTTTLKPIKQDPFKIDGELPALARFGVFAAQFCRAKQALDLMDSVFQRQGKANILINGADTCLGYTLIQILNSSLYRDTLQAFNIILVVSECEVAKTEALVTRLGSGGMRKFHVISYDVENTDLRLKGEKLPVCYKKPQFFASEVLNCLFEPFTDFNAINKSNIKEAKLDLFVDIIGSKKMFQKAFDLKDLDDGNFPFKAHIASGLKASSLLGVGKEPLFTRILKPKNLGSAYVSYCKFTLAEPSYLIDKLVDYSLKSVFDPWSMRWSSDLANQLTKYNYYEKFDLEIRKTWVHEGLQLVLNGELKMHIEDFVDWRTNFRNFVDKIKKHDGQVVFKVEPF